MLILSVLGGGGWLWQCYRVPAATPPVLDWHDADPAVVRAIEKERQGVLQAPRSAAAWGRLASILTAFNYRPEALLCFAQAERLDPREPRWPYHQGILLLIDKPHEAIPYLERTVQLCGEKNLAPRLRLSEALLTLDRPEEAEAGFRFLHQRDPGNPRVQLGLGRLALRRQQWTPAQAHLQAAAASRHSARAALLALLEIHQRRGDEKAVEQLRGRLERLSADASWPDPYIDEIRNLHVGKRFRLIQADQLFLQGHAEEAIAQLKELVEDYPHSPEVWFALGQVLHGCGLYPRSEAAMRRVVELRPGYAEAHNYLGAAQLRQGKLAEAAAALRKAIELKPDFALAYLNLGRCLLRQQDASGALEAFRAAVRCKPDYAAAHTELAELLHQTHQDAEAREQIRQALQLNPHDERAKQLREKLGPK